MFSKATLFLTCQKYMTKGFNHITFFLWLLKQLLEQMPSVISSLDAHVESGLHWYFILIFGSTL